MVLILNEITVPFHPNHNNVPTEVLLRHNNPIQRFLAVHLETMFEAGSIMHLKMLNYEPKYESTMTHCQWVIAMSHKWAIPVSHLCQSSSSNLLMGSWHSSELSLSTLIWFSKKFAKISTRTHFFREQNLVANIQTVPSPSRVNTVVLQLHWKAAAEIGK